MGKRFVQAARDLVLVERGCAFCRAVECWQYGFGIAASVDVDPGVRDGEGRAEPSALACSPLELAACCAFYVEGEQQCLHCDSVFWYFCLAHL